MKKILFVLFSFISIFYSDFIFAKNIKFIGLSKLSLDDLDTISPIPLNKESYDELELNSIIKALYNSELINDVSYEINTDSYILKISETPIVENIYINGNIYIKDDDLVNLINSKKNSLLNKVFIEKDITLIKNLYLSQGFEDTYVSASTEKFSENNVNLIYEIKEGNRVVIKSINFYGNLSFSNNYLLSKINSKQVNFYNFFTQGSNINNAIFQNDLNILKDFYRKKGFDDVDISYNISKNFLNYYELNFYINENNKFTLSEINFSFSNELWDLKEYSNITNDFKIKISKNGGFFDYFVIEELINELNEINYKNNIHKSIDFELTKSETDFKINFFDQTSQISTVNNIEFYGNTITKSKTLMSKINLSPGDYVSKFKLEQNNNKIQNLPYINKSSYEINENSNNSSNIIFQIDESKKTGNFLLGGTFNGDLGLGFKTSLNDINFLGSGNEVQADFSINSEATFFDISYIDYPLSYSNLSNRYNISNNEFDYISSFGYKSKEQTVGYSLNFKYSEDLSSSIGFRLAKIQGHSPKNTSDLFITDNIGSDYNSILKFSISQNKTNNPLYPSNGYSNSLSINLAPKYISDTSYITATYQGDYYFSFNDSDNYFYISNRVGAGEAIDGRLKTINSFSLGGQNFKGFDYRGIGNRTSNNIYVGGKKYFTNTVGYGTSFLFDKKDNIYFRLFTTSGSLWDNDYIDQDYKLRTSAGISLDFLSAVGPISFSYAIPIEKSDNDNLRRFNFSIGSVF